MLVLVSAFLLLIVAPATLLVLGRAIVRVTDFEARREAAVAVKQAAGDAWYYRTMRPAFTWVDDAGE